MFTQDAPEQQQPIDRRTPAPERPQGPMPLDLRQTRFATSMRGYNRDEVRTFLLEAADGYEQALRENERLRHEIARLDGSLKQYRDLENSLNQTLLHAQRVADDMKANATQEAARLVREAEGRAELVMLAAQTRLEDAQREIDGLRLKRREAEGTVESIISSLHSTLEFIRTQQRDPRVVPHRPRVEQAS
jgi:cell division initiation protein